MSEAALGQSISQLKHGITNIDTYTIHTLY